MIRNPYIFLSQNYAKYALDEQVNEVSWKNLENRPIFHSTMKEIKEFWDIFQKDC